MRELDLEKAAFIIYLIVLILSPLLFGAVHAYAYTIMTIGVLAGSLLLMMKNTGKNLKSGIYEFKFPVTSLNFTFLVILVFLLFQSIPMPDFLLGLLSPEAETVGQKSLPASRAVVQGSEGNAWFALSPYYYPVRMSIVKWSVYGLFFLGLTQVLNSRKRIELTVFLILITGCFEALYGLAETYSGSGHIWWYKKTAYIKDVTGTYINRNHLAGLMEMGLLLAAAYSAALFVRKRKRRVISGGKGRLGVRISQFLSGEQLFNKRILIVFAGAVMGVGLVFSASRGGLIAAAGSMLCMGLLFIFRKDHRRKGFIILFLFLITTVYALNIGIEYTLSRFESFDVSFEVRKRYAQKTMKMFQDYRLTGTGVGNFKYAYAKYQAPEDKEVFLRHAHNDWAQFLAEAGTIGMTLLLAGISYYLYRTIKLWKRRSDPFAVCLGAVPLAAMMAMAIHSCSDFNLHIPANFLMLVAIMAIGYSALHLERRRGRDRILYRYRMIPLKYRGILVLVPVLGLIIWNGVWTIRHFVAEAYCDTIGNSTLNRDQNPPLREIRKAIEWDRWNAHYWYKEAQGLARMRDAGYGVQGASGFRMQDLQKGIIMALEEAVRLNPFEAQYHIRLGWEYLSPMEGPDYHWKWLHAADLSMERAAYFAGDRIPRQHVRMGNYWIYRSKIIGPGSLTWPVAWARACRHYRRAQSLEGKKSLTDRIAKYVWTFYPDVELVRELTKKR